MHHENTKNASVVRENSIVNEFSRDNEFTLLNATRENEKLKTKRWERRCWMWIVFTFHCVQVFQESKTKVFLKNIFVHFEQFSAKIFRHKPSAARNPEIQIEWTRAVSIWGRYYRKPILGLAPNEFRQNVKLNLGFTFKLEEDSLPTRTAKPSRRTKPR